MRRHNKVPLGDHLADPLLQAGGEIVLLFSDMTREFPKDILGWPPTTLKEPQKKAHFRKEGSFPKLFQVIEHSINPDTYYRSFLKAKLGGWLE